MEIQCPKCNKSHAVSSADSFKLIICDCGQKIEDENESILKKLNEICEKYQLKLEEEKITQIKKEADRIISLIINSKCDYFEIQSEKKKLKELLNSVSPEEASFYELIYEPRFERLWEKFRESDSNLE